MLFVTDDQECFDTCGRKYFPNSYMQLARSFSISLVLSLLGADLPMQRTSSSARTRIALLGMYLLALDTANILLAGCGQRRFVDASSALLSAAASLRQTSLGTTCC